MELVVELPALASNKWFDDVTRRLGDNPLLAGIEFTQVKPPIGGMGADVVPRLKAALDVTRDVAGVIAAVVAIAAAVHSGSTPTGTCNLRMTKGTETIALTVPCDQAPSDAFVDNVAKFIAQSPSGNVTLRVTPRVEPAP